MLGFIGTMECRVLNYYNTILTSVSGNLYQNSTRKQDDSAANLSSFYITA